MRVRTYRKEIVSISRIKIRTEINTRRLIIANCTINFDFNSPTKRSAQKKQNGGRGYERNEPIIPDAEVQERCCALGEGPRVVYAKDEAIDVAHVKEICFIEIKSICLVIFKGEQGHGAGGDARISERVKENVLQLESLRRARKW
jgi:hypothetical protein